MIELEPAHLRALRQSRIEPPFCLYDPRRTYGIRAVEAGIGVFIVAKLMDHAYLSATQRSIHFGQGDWEDAQKKEMERFRARLRSLYFPLYREVARAGNCPNGWKNAGRGRGTKLEPAERGPLQRSCKPLHISFEHYLVMGAIQRLLEFYWVGRLLCLLAGEPFFEINQDISPLPLYKSTVGLPKFLRLRRILMPGIHRVVGIAGIAGVARI